MSKFCPMCNQTTNCTENCKDCLKEDTKKRYALTICARTDYEQVVYAHLSKDDLAAIEKSIFGELNGQYIITLDDGETIDIEVVDYVEEV